MLWLCNNNELDALYILVGDWLRLGTIGGLNYLTLRHRLTYIPTYWIPSTLNLKEKLPRLLMTDAICNGPLLLDGSELASSECGPRRTLTMSWTHRAAGRPTILLPALCNNRHHKNTKKQYSLAFGALGDNNFTDALMIPF